MTPDEIIDAILNGKLDEHLDTLDAVIQDRRTLNTTRKMATLKPGDTVVFSDSIRPKYLVGKTATVVKRNPKSVVVSCPDDLSYRRYRNAKNVRCPNSLIAGKADD